jgi:hypothetical protein
MPTREECIAAAGRVAAEGYQILFTFPLDEAARRAVRPGGPSFQELRERIARKRAERAKFAPSAQREEAHRD